MIENELNNNELTEDGLFESNDKVLSVNLKQDKIDKKAQKLKAKKKPLTDRQIDNIAKAREKKAFADEVAKAKLSYKEAIKKNKELKKEFIATRTSYATKQEFKIALKSNEASRLAVLDNVKEQYFNIRREFSRKYRTFSFMITRWYYGMGKEFNRISWINANGVLKNFIIVAITMLTSATFFFLLDLLIRQIL